MSNLEIKIRELKPDQDLKAVMTIESISYENPWTERQFYRWFRRSNVARFVATQNNKVLGFAIVEIFKDCFHVIDLAVHPKHRKHKVGYKLLSSITKQLFSTKRHMVITYVRESNLEAQLFLRYCGFRAVSTLKRHYEDTQEDCYRMEYRNNWPEKDISKDKFGKFAKAK